MKTYFAYIRVSTTRQGDGVSLIEQKSSIEAFAERRGLQIAQWFEERETAAKQGRRQFSQLLAALRRQQAAGVIMHKIDRSARNLRDWARLGELIDEGIEVHFVHDGVDLASRGGRLSADIQAVVAADYVRNLRDEVKKGFYGRLKQGFYPLPAPRGYLNRGKAQAKEIDPITGPLVRQAFERYAQGSCSLDMLRLEMHERGLSQTSGRPLSRSNIADMLHNPFYTGLIHIKRTRETFQGVHAPLVPKSVFDRVQAVASGRAYRRPQRHAFAFSRLIRCAGCGRSLVGELRKGHIYYRCHSPSCKGTSLKEAAIDQAVCAKLRCLTFEEGDLVDVGDVLDEMSRTEQTDRQQRTAALDRDLGLCEERLRRLTDAFLDGTIEQPLFEDRKRSLYDERLSLEERKSTAFNASIKTIQEIVGRGNMAYLQYAAALPTEKRDIVNLVMSDLVARGKELAIKLQNPFDAVENWHHVRYGGACRAEPRTNADECPISDMSARGLVDTLICYTQKQDGTSSTRLNPSS